jgi:hypothetical protein
LTGRRDRRIGYPPRPAVPATIDGRRVIGVERQRDRWVAIVEDGDRATFVALG